MGIQDFTYFNPVKIFFGKDSSKEITEAVSNFNRVMMIYGGGSIKSNGAYEDAKAALGDKLVCEFSGIEPNPKYETCLKAAAMIKENKCDFLLAVGGGSVLDATKFIATAAESTLENPWDHIEKGEPVLKTLPFGAIITLPATGSEMNAGAVISKDGKKLPFICGLNFPKFSVLNPEYTYSLSKVQLCNGLVDTFVHVTEQYVTSMQNTPLQDRQAEAILKTVIDIYPKVLDGKADYETMATFMWCAANALNGTISSGTQVDWLTHMIGHSTTSIYNIDHAQTLAIMLPGVWKYQFKKRADKLAHFGKSVFKFTGGSSDEIAHKAILKTEDIFKSMGMRTKISEYVQDNDAPEKIASNFVDVKHHSFMFPDITKDDIIAIVKSRL